MTAPKWTILIATLGRRKDRLARLLGGLLPQVEAAGGAVTVEALWNHGERPVGRVRQDLLEGARSEYVCFVDDDDEVPDYYVARVLPLLDGVDFIGWRMQVWINGTLQPGSTVHSLAYASDRQSDGVLYRNVSHLNPVRRDLTAGTSFCRGWPEDADWCGQMRAKLRTETYIGTEHYIDDVMYLYRHDSRDTVQYGRQMVKIRILQQMSGAWHEGQLWPPPGTEAWVHQDEAAQLTRADPGHRSGPIAEMVTEDMTHLGRDPLAGKLAVPGGRRRLEVDCPYFSWHPNSSPPLTEFVANMMRKLPEGK